MESEENFLIFPASINKSQGERKRKGRPRKKGRGGTRQFARGRNTKLTRKTDKLIRAVNAQLFPAGKRSEAEREARSSPELKVERSTRHQPDRPMSEKESRSRRQSNNVLQVGGGGCHWWMPRQSRRRGSSVKPATLLPPSLLLVLSTSSPGIFDQNHFIIVRQQSIFSARDTRSFSQLQVRWIFGDNVFEFQTQLFG